MTTRAFRLALLACTALQAGCWTVPRPYEKDPLIQNEKRQRGSFERAGPQLPVVEPGAPAAPPGIPEWVDAEHGSSDRTAQGSAQ
jgi:hypothetical protein